MEQGKKKLGRETGMPRLQLLEDNVLLRTGQELRNKLACGCLDRHTRD